MIALVVTLDVHLEHLQQFLDAIKENANRTFSDEAGCRYFDVAQDTSNPTHFIFYELYDDEAAIEAHRRTAHFVKWRKVADHCIVEGSQMNTTCRQLLHYS